MENPVRKRRRPAVTCIECRRRKVKCDRALPCGPCILSSLPCTYNSPFPHSQALHTDSGDDSAVRLVTRPSWEPSAAFTNDDDGPIWAYTTTQEEDISGTIQYPAIASTRCENNSLSISSQPLSITPTTSRLQDFQTFHTSFLSRASHLGHNHWKNVFEQARFAIFRAVLPQIQLTFLA